MSNPRVIATGLEFPEGPVVMPDGSVILVEIRAQRLTRVFPDGRKEVIAQIPGGPNGAALGPDGKIYVCNNGGFSWAPSRGIIMPGAPSASEYIGGSIQRVDIQSGKIETLFDKVGDHPLKGPNDLVFDRQGGLWFTDLGKRRARDMDVGAFYYMKPGASGVVEGHFGMLPANGIGLSPDEKTVYVAETPTARLWAFKVGEPGEIVPTDVIYRGERGRPIAGLGGYQMFDSLAVEASGNVCVATLINGGISVIAPDGKLIEHVPTGDNVTTNIAFGGPELKTAYITLSGKGELVMMDWPRGGLPLNFLNR
ncbi:SMP-30/gluconolactonase/LRE family protein [Bradyrhizobium prioriisuperbiae]|uniref:SMP-30/gluconolactonase/LRE family protein n=1 Tax=Bradyrhizobium prioriisuperbiae TaxID=2854389 RepID=UPI0028EE0D78|nr:SMP-30/gluconolactonase/LRE family protein [Bradyrhizobium prioritasuperba]